MVSTHSSAGRGGSFRSYMMKENKANANLIAVAPEMFDLIKRFLTAPGYKSGKENTAGHMIRDMEAVIAKAEGCSEKDGEEIDDDINDLKENEANANLIASAPELLKLAKMERDKYLFGEAKFFIKYGVNWNDIKGVRKMLIAKAEGGAK